MMNEKQTAAKKAIDRLHLECHESTAWDIQNKVNEAYEEIRMNAIYDARRVLLDHASICTYENGHACDAISIRTVDELPRLMHEEDYDWQRHQYDFNKLMEKFPPEFKEMYMTDAYCKNVIECLLRGGNVYHLYFDHMKRYNKIQKAISKAMMYMPDQKSMDKVYELLKD